MGVTFLICSNCGFDNPSAMAFCGRCGTRLGRQCRNCGEEVPSDFTFCGNCGALVGEVAQKRAAEAPLPRGERRNVSVLFADVSGFTPLAEKLDPEELTSLLQDCFSELKQEVLLREGWPAKYMGDAILAIFGAPVAHEDDPVRAVRTALAMQARMRSMNRRLEPSLSGCLDLHIGVNTGLVVAGPTTSDADEEEFTVLGDAVNVGARLQQTAPAGRIVVGETTYLASDWAFEYRELQPLKLKGKREKVNAYECLGPRARPLSPRGLEGIQAPMLGRDREVDQLLYAFDEVDRGGPQVVSLSGDAGIGKSRLVKEFGRKLNDSQRLTPDRWWIAYATTDRPVPFGVVRSLLSPHIQGERDIEKQLRSLLGESEDDEFRYLDPEHRKQRLYLVAYELVATLAKEEPLVLVVEDLHWADEASLDLLRFLAARQGDLKLMLLVTFRPELALPITSTRSNVISLSVTPLEKGVTSELLKAFFGPSFHDFPEDVVEMLVERSEGNPFYLEELVRSLILQGVIRREERWRVDHPAGELVVPDSIQGLLFSRMDRLDTEMRLVLQEASVLGLTFPARLVSAYVTTDMSGTKEMEELVAGDWLASMIDSRTGEISYRFQHTLVRQVAYESLLIRARKALHLRAALTIEQLYADDLGEFYVSLAEHYLHAGESERSVAYLLSAGDRAQALFANVEAALSYRRALAILQEDQRGERARVWALLGDSLRSQALFDESLPAWEKALEFSGESGDADASISLHRRMANALWSRGQVEAARAHLADALALVDREKDTREAAALYQEFASQALHRGGIKEGIEWSQLALGVSQKIGAFEQSVRAATTLGVALARSGDVESGRESIEEALRIAREKDLPVAAGRAAVNLAVLYANIDPLHAAEICSEGLAEARRIGDVEIESWFHSTLAGSLHACASDYETATKAAEVSIEIDRQLGLSSHLPVPLVVLGQIHQCHERYEQAERCYQEALEIAEELGDPQLLFPALEGLGTLYLERGDERAKGYMDRAQGILEEAGLPSEDMVLLPYFL